MSKRIEFNCADELLIRQIVGRWVSYLKRNDLTCDDALSIEMDLMAANGVNGNAPLDLGRLMEADEFNFAHDMSGIQRHLNRQTGRIGNFFLPRFAIPEVAAEEAAE